MAKPVNDSPLASLLPDEMVAGGLADDFDGVVREARYAPWDYNGKIDTPVLAIRLKIERLEQGLEEEERFVTTYHSAGKLDAFYPSMDGVNKSPNETIEVDGNMVDRIGEGVYALRVGTKTALNNNTNAAQLMRSFLDAQVPRDKFRPDVRFIEGIKGHWNRLPPDKKGGEFKPKEGQEDRKRGDIVCLTRFDGYEVGKSSGASATVPASSSGTTTKANATNGSGGSIDAKLIDIVKATVKVGAPAMKKSALSGAVLKAAKADKEVNKMVKRVSETEFLEGLVEANIIYDAEAGTLEAIAVDA